MDNKITVTSPLLPSLDEFTVYLKDIWQRKWLTNNGYYHQELEQALAKYLKINNISLFTNGTLPLLTALQILDIQGKVITTPFSFIATSNALWWRNIKPVFVDIDEHTCNIDPQKIEAAITPATTAIMAVHVYGYPCDVEQIEKIAKKHNLKVIYDAAHAFAVEINNTSILEYGDISTLSFHATKTYNTIEGGALITNDKKIKELTDNLKNFGFTSDVDIVAPGLNGKMDEIRAAYGLLLLKDIDQAITKRQYIARLYREQLEKIEGITFLNDMPNVRHNYSYFPIFIDVNKYGMTRDQLFNKLISNNIIARKYFYPLISNFTPYKDLSSSAIDNLPMATKKANSVLCLPMHHDLTEETISFIINIIKGK